jgi:protein tyrosine phosphatase (PTP) superfamily phosphohydrolase (DUF442 family)
MKSGTFFFIISLFLVHNLNAQSKISKADSVEVISDFKNLFKYQNFYLGGHQTIEELQWLKSQGVTKIINLRSERENKDYSEFAYNEEPNAKALGFEYCSVPVDGLKDYTPEKLDDLTKQINPNEKVLIHCASGGRATDFFMAYLIKSKGYSINEAGEIGRQLKFSLPLEKLLNTKISMDTMPAK